MISLKEQHLLANNNRKLIKTTRWVVGVLTIVLLQNSATADTASEGIRVGLQVGYGLIDSTVKNTQSLPPNAQDTSSISGRGAVGGVTIDWTTLVGHSDILVGAEASFNYITSKGKKSTQNVNLGGANPSDLSTNIVFKRSFDFVAKAGYLFKQAGLAYIKLGPSMSHWRASSVSDALPASGGIGTKILGVIVGIGAEFPLSERLSFGAEYNYRQYKNFSHTLNGLNNPILKVDVKPNTSAIMLRLNYKVSAVNYAPAPVKKRKRKRPRRPPPVPAYPAPAY